MSQTIAGHVRRTLSSRVFREVAITYTGQLFGSGIGFLIAVLLQRKLGSADYGLLGLAGSVGMLTVVLTDLGIGHAMVRYGSKYLAEGRVDLAMPRFAAAFRMQMGLSCVVALVGFASASLVAEHLFHKPDLRWPLAFQFLGVIASTAYAFWVYYIQSWQRFKLRSLVQVCLAVVKLLAFGVLWMLGVLSPSAAILLDLGASALGFTAGMLISPRGLLSVPRAEWIHAARTDILPFCRFTGVLIVGDVLFNELDTFLLGVYCDESVVGVYRCAWTYAMVLGFLNNSVSSVLFPKITGITSPQELRSFLRSALKLTSLLAVATLPAVPFLSWWIPWYSPDFAGAVPVFYAMYVGLVFEMVVGPLNYAMYTLNRPQFLVANAGLKITLNAATALLLIPRFGAVGAATATVGTRIVGGFVLLWFLRRVLRERASGV